MSKYRSMFVIYRVCNGVGFDKKVRFGRLYTASNAIPALQRFPGSQLPQTLSETVTAFWMTETFDTVTF